MNNDFESLLAHLEELDGRLAQVVEEPKIADSKLVKEVLFARLKLRQLAQQNWNACPERFRNKIDKIHSGKGYNIDELNARYCNSVTCPTCNTSDVAVIRPVPSRQEDTGYDVLNNRRLKLVLHDMKRASGRFSCNRCLSSFDPPLPADVLRLCEILFAYYH